MILLMLPAALAQQAGFDAGIAALRQGDYPAAAESLVASLDAGGVDPAVYHALGNALYRQDRHGAAIAAWSRGLALSPGDGDLAANRDRARGQTRDRLEPPEPSYGPFFWQGWLSLRASAALSSLGFTLAILLLGLSRRRAATLSASLGVLLLASTLLARSTTAGAVVIRESISARSALGPDGVELFVLHEGAEVGVEERTGEHTLIVLPDLRRGWVPSEALISTDPEDAFPLDVL
jgi:tetratricopeptide (TPR) repeat protein